jgi:hypothetical protein
MAKTKKIIEPLYTPPPIRWYFYIGDKYYKRLQPIPYAYDTNFVKKLRNIFLSELKS